MNPFKHIIRSVTPSAWLAPCILALGFVFALPALAQSPLNYPTKPIRVIVPYGPGGATDTISRQIAAQMSILLGQPVIVENRGGAGGLSAIQDLMNSPADGYTVLNADAGHWAILPQLQAVPYDALRDFMPVGLIFTSPQFYVVPASLPVNSLQEFIALARAKPGTLNYGTPGIGGPNHLHGEMFKSALGLDIKHIPYKGGGEALEALLRNDIQLTLTALAASQAHIKAGKLKMLAVGTQNRTKIAPDVPTVSEVTGVKDFDFAGQMAMVARAGTPKPILDKLSAALAKAVMTPDIVAKAFTGGVDMTPSTPEQLDALIRSDIQKYGKAIKVSGAKIQ